MTEKKRGTARLWQPSLTLMVSLSLHTCYPKTNLHLPEELIIVAERFPFAGIFPAALYGV